MFNDFGSFGGGGGGYGGDSGGYDANSQMGGGYGGGGFGSTQQTNSKKRGLPQKTTDGVMPCMIGQILSSLDRLSSPDDSLVINGKECSQVTVVGRVTSKEKGSMTITWKVRDFSGEVVVKKYLESESTIEARLDSIEEGALVRVVGMMRNAQKFLSAFGIRTCADNSELFFHESQCAAIHLKSKQSDSNDGYDFNTAVTAKPTEYAPVNPNPTQGDAGSGDVGNPAQDSITLSGLLLKNKPSRGYSIEEMCKLLSWNTNRATGAVRALEDEGEIFETQTGRYSHVEAE
eukprot:GHVL01002688.1.p1 GENE.GHVL01002688.1~~GHVL01002688.1.p1  ORF type:complete len:289 (+),score=50.15 GHVL01002688.1:53-919(+)